MIINKQGKFFGKVSIIDICVILVVIIGILGSYITVSRLKSDKMDTNSNLALLSDNPMESATLTLKLKGVRSMTRDALLKGDEMYTTDTESKYIGKVRDISSESFMQNMVLENGEIVKAEVPDRFTVTVLVDIKGKNTNTGFFTESGVQLLYGDSIEIKTSTIKSLPEIYGIEINNAGE